MFQNQNTNTKTTDDQEIEDIPVHTMSQDLEEVNNPGTKKIDDQKIEASPQRNPLNQNNLTAIQKSSPFLNPAPEIKKPEPLRVTPPAKMPPIAPPEKKSVPSESFKKPENIGAKQPAKKVTATIFASLIILAIIGGGYYFWKARQQKVVEVAEDPQIVETIPEEPAPEPVKIETFSTDKPNYLSLDLSRPETAKNTLLSYADKFYAAGITSPVDFIVVDNQNNPIKFSDFSKALNIGLSKNTLSKLKDEFILDFYNDQGVIRLGLLLGPVNTTDLKNVLLKKALVAEEEGLIAKLEPLFLTSEYKIGSTVFQNSAHNGTSIRYLNLLSDAQLSIDYAFFKDYVLVIGTSKMTVRAIIDVLAANKTY